MYQRIQQYAIVLMTLGAISYNSNALGADDLAAAKAMAVNHCGSCHTFGKGEPPGQGPNLFGIIGRKAGTAVAFNYSERFKKAMEGQTWDEKLLDRWLTDTQVVAPGSGMVYSQDDASKRKKLIRFLSSLQ
ncbi:c-type cytochrome [Undibacterium arcticum]|uniref:C-type cytochrome n=1 Tax=Undibacterium arcticum TaxID=1762892 RepID=A0ABV7F855_9BURK